MVKRYFFYFLFLCLSHALLAQNLERVDALVLSYTKQFSSPKQLADQISKDFETDIERVRAAYTWIAYHVQYDIQEGNFPSYSYVSEEDRIVKEQKYAAKLSKRVITKKKAVCEGYSYLFKTVCESLQIKTTVVTGASKTLSRDIGRRYNSDHAWNIVTIDNQKYFIDVTWASTLNMSKADINYYYFMTSPELFILDHYPDIYSNSLLDTKISKKEFLENPLLYDYTPTKVKLIYPFEGVLIKNKKHAFKFDVTEPVTWIQAKMGKESINIKTYTHQNSALEFDLGIPGYSKARDVIIFINGIPIVTYAIK